MVQYKQAYTLIELLVVVLIIGALAAVALPQYRLAVAKAKYTQLMATVSAVKNAQEVYYLANGKYASNLEELDVSIPGEGKIITLPWGAKAYDLTDGNSLRMNSDLIWGSNITQACANYEVYLDHSSRPGTIYCYAQNYRNCSVSFDIGPRLCKAMGGEPAQDRTGSNADKYYILK